MVRRRRNKVVLWEWMPGKKSRKPRRETPRPRAVAPQAVGAVALLAGIVFLVSRVTEGTGDYGRGDLAAAMCLAVGVAADAPACLAVSIGGWFVIVVAIGVVLKAGRAVLNLLRGTD
jgi:hypothetical protein